MLAHLLRDRKLVRTAIACPFVQASVCGYDQEIGTSGAEKHDGGEKQDLKKLSFQ